MKISIGQYREQLGWQGMSGIVLLVLAGAFHMLALAPLEQETGVMHSRFDAVLGKSSASGKAASLVDRRGELGSFFQSLPVERDVPDILAAIHAEAETSGVELAQADYLPDSGAQPRMEYAMTFPVRGEYPNIRFFVLRVLADQPAIALDELNFQRDKVSDPMLKAEIRFTLFLRRENLN